MTHAPTNLWLEIVLRLLSIQKYNYLMILLVEDSISSLQNYPVCCSLLHHSLIDGLKLHKCSNQLLVGNCPQAAFYYKNIIIG